MADDTVVIWKEEYSVKNKIIDEQHKALIQMINEFYAGCRKGGITEKVTFMKTIQGAVDYAKSHFATEENLMRQTNYPDYAAHKKEHEDFVAEVVRQVKNFEENNDFNTEGFARFLLDWVLNHVGGSDRKYIPYMQDSG